MHQVSASPYTCPPVVTSTLLTRRNHPICVVRDDYLKGGTKERALEPWLSQLRETEFIYASPFSGFAQIALAHVSRDIGRKCVIVAETDPSTGELHPYSLRAREAGAIVHPSRNLGEAEEIAQLLAEKRTEMIKIPLGFDVPEFRHSMARVLGDEWEKLNSSVPGGIRRLWLPVGSGTLASSFLSFLPESVEVIGLNVRVLSDSDQRLGNLRTKIDLRKAKMPFHERAELLPEIPSNLYYDAKIWAYLEEEGLPGDVWWNVAG